MLPGVPDEEDACIARFTNLLQARGLEKVHVVEQECRPVLCLHYDPAKFNLTQVRSLTQAAGAQIGARYQPDQPELMRIDSMDCSTCATIIEHALQRLDGT